MSKENKTEGNNPLFEAHDSVDKGPSGTQPSTPEDARYRPGNNKTAKVEATGASESHETVEYKDPEDMTTRSKAATGKTKKPN
jgi:hypothetical protein